MKTYKVSAPGKLHLLGEHAVVYNKPAIIIAVDKRCYVEISERKDSQIKISSKNYKKNVSTNSGKIQAKWEKAEEDWQSYNENNDVLLLKKITQDELDYPQIIVGQFFNYHKINSKKGFDLTIDSQVPVGSGMGSSASLAVSTIGALTLFFGKSFDKKIINEIAFLSEQKKHGKPSGGDNSTSCFGKLVWFKKGEGLKPLGFEISPDITKNFYIINTGIPKETTGEMVSIVRDLISKRELFVKEILDKQEELVKDLRLALEKNIPRQIPGIIKSGEKNLEKLGVVSDFVKGIIIKIEESGGAAKICGAGGITKSTGIILIYNSDREALRKALNTFKFTPTQIKLGVEGLRQEK